jgi:release factor glutamine methyltransferase
MRAGREVTLVDIGEGGSREAAVGAVRRAFAAAGLDTPALDARRLAAEAFGVTGAALLAYPEAAIDAAAARRLAAFAERRLEGEPVARILGEAEFWGLPFRLSPATLAPRADTETVVETALRLLPDRKASPRILDLGTGSGCLLVALLSEYASAWGVGVDRAEAALHMAAGNAALNGVTARAAFTLSDWADALRGPFDLVVSNPPYIRSALIDGLAPEVALHDPRAALDGGSDGLEAYRAILACLADLLAPRGLAVLEIGFDQASSVRGLSERHGFRVVGIARDLGGRDRAVALAPDSGQGLPMPRARPI